MEDVIKNTPESHSDKANLKEALSQIEAVAWHINEQLREHENRFVGLNRYFKFRESNRGGPI